MTDQVTWSVGDAAALTPFENRPRARKVLTTDTAHVVLFAFAAGQELAEHATRHAAVVHCLRGRVVFTAAGESRELVPGDLVHLTPQLRHAVTAVEDALVSVTMLLGVPDEPGAD